MTMEPKGLWFLKMNTTAETKSRCSGSIVPEKTLDHTTLVAQDDRKTYGSDFGPRAHYLQFRNEVIPGLNARNGNKASTESPPS